MSAPASENVGRKSATRRGAALALLVVAIGAGWIVWRWATAAQPPEVLLTGADPEFADAVHAARRAVDHAPRSVEAWGNLGMLLRAADHFDGAVRCFTQAEQLDPTEPRWPYLHGEAQVKQNQHAAALAPLARAAGLSAADRRRAFAPLLRWAEALLATDQPEAAEVPLQQAREREPEHPNVHLALAHLARSRGAWDDADQHLQRCLHSPFTQRRAHSLRAEVLQRRGETDLAAEAGRRAVALPADANWMDDWLLETLEHAVGKTSRLRACDQLMASGRADEALRVLADLSRTETDPRIAVSLGRVHLARGDFSRAEPAFRRALALEPNSVAGHYYLSRLLGMHADRLRQEKASAVQIEAAYRAAADSARAALAQQPDHALAHLVLGVSLERAGERPAALAALEQAVALAPELVEPALQLGELLLDAQRWDEARPHLERAARFSTADDPRPKAALARLAKATGR